jgi:hypothetical protein
MVPAGMGRSYTIREGNDRMASHKKHLSRFGAAVAVSACAILFSAQSAAALDISFRSFSGSKRRPTWSRISRMTVTCIL